MKLTSFLDVTVSLNTEAESPMEQCHSTAFTADYGHHHPGQMKLFEPEEQTSSLLLLPPFVIHKILQILGNILILETCRSAYLIIAPMFKWVDLPKLKYVTLPQPPAFPFQVPALLVHNRREENSEFLRSCNLTNVFLHSISSAL